MAALLNESRLKPFLVPILGELIDDVAAAASGRAALECAALFGSGVTADFVPKKSNVNVLLVFDSAGFDLLAALKPVFKKHNPKLKANPVVIDREYIANSTDVFPMEFLEWKERHVVIFGEDLISGIDVSTANLRREIEENLRGKKLRLMQSFFEIPVEKGKIQDFLEFTLPNFTVVFRNIIRLTGATPSQDTAEVFREAAKITGAHLSTFIRLRQIKTQSLRIKPPETELLFKGVLAEVDSVIRWIDKYDPTGQGK